LALGYRRTSILCPDYESSFWVGIVIERSPLNYKLDGVILVTSTLVALKLLFFPLHSLISPVSLWTDARSMGFSKAYPLSSLPQRQWIHLPYALECVVCREQLKLISFVLTVLHLSAPGRLHWVSSARSPRFPITAFPGNKEHQQQQFFLLPEPLVLYLKGLKGIEM